MQSELVVTRVTTYSAKIIRLKPQMVCSTPVRRELVYHDIENLDSDDFSTIRSTTDLKRADLSNSLENLEDHLNDEPSFRCEICGVSFFHALSREAHLLSHTGGTIPRPRRKLPEKSLKRKVHTPTNKLTKFAKAARLDMAESSPFTRSIRKIRSSLRRKK